MSNLQDLYFNPSAVLLGVDNDGFYKIRYQGTDSIVTDFVEVVHPGAWLHVRVTDAQRAQLDTDNVSYRTHKTAAADNKTPVGGPNHVFGPKGSGVRWTDTSSNDVIQKPEDSEPTILGSEPAPTSAVKAKKVK